MDYQILLMISYIMNTKFYISNIYIFIKKRIILWNWNKIYINN